jgi:hypothetical protein
MSARGEKPIERRVRRGGRGAWAAFIATTAIASSALATPAAAFAKLPFYPIHRIAISVPKTVQPWASVWSPDGRHIVFENQLNGAIWSASAEGRVSCITCSFRDAPNIEGGLHYVLPDEQRMFISHQLGGTGGVDWGPNADAWILECSPNLYRCDSHRYLPVDMSQDKAGGALIVQRRTWHLAPDGIHLGWMDVRPDATVMIVGRLQREAGGYLVADERVVNPGGPTSLTDTDPLRWANGGQLYELKSFADGGRSILVVGEPQGDPDVTKIDLLTGRRTQLTSNRDWDEDGAISPDGSLYALYSSRTRSRVEALGWIPQLPPFFELPLAAAYAIYGSTWQAFQCDLSPWLLGSQGDAGGKLIGQPLNTYGGDLTAGDLLSGQQMWSPDSTEVLLQETLRKRPPPGSNSAVAQIGLTPNRVLIARIGRTHGRRQPVLSSTVGPWAPTPAAYAGTIGAGTTVTLRGRGGGAVTLRFSGNLGQGSWSAAFQAYSPDGRTFLNGSESTAGSATGTLRVTAAITVSGANTGRLSADLVIANGQTPPQLSGYYRASYDERTAPPIARAGPCYSRLPRNSPLIVGARVRGAQLVVTVSADVYGDQRPVSGAVVTVGQAQARTNRNGTAGFRRPAAGRTRIVATAGDTFTPRALLTTVR